jgi:hypothetical protein
MLKMGHFRLCHFWSTSGLIARRFLSGPRDDWVRWHSFLTAYVWGPSKFGVGGGRQAIAFAKLLPAYSIAPKIEPAVQYDNSHAQHASCTSHPPPPPAVLLTAPLHETYRKVEIPGHGGGLTAITLRGPETTSSPADQTPPF